MAGPVPALRAAVLHSGVRAAAPKPLAAARAPLARRALHHITEQRAAAFDAAAYGIHSDVEKDHRTLESLLDRPVTPKMIPTAYSPLQDVHKATGLFKVPSLKEPRDYMELAEKALVRSRLLVNRIVAAGQAADSSEELAKVVINIDRLSDLLCGVIDMAELVRHAHPDPAWIGAANDAYEYLCSYMNVLNTHTGLYDVLRRVMADDAIVRTMSEEAKAVAMIFLRDFEKSGIHLPPEQRQRFVELNDEILVLGRQFLQDISAGSESSAEVTDFPLDLLKGMDYSALTNLRAYSAQPRKKNTIPVLPSSWELYVISRFAPDPRARHLAYLVSYTGRPEPVQVLERLLRARAELATLTGRRSFAEFTLLDKMAKTPENVANYLRHVEHTQRPHAQRTLDQLRSLKEAQEGPGPMGRLPPFYAWDREYYSEQLVEQSRTRRMAPLSPYFSLGTVFTGISRMFYLLYGIHFRAAPVQPGETWSDEVLKLEVLDESEGGVIGTIYCDLFTRRGKPPSAAHYTVRCSRRTDRDDVENDVRLGWDPSLPRDIDTGNLFGVEGQQLPGRAGRYQLPIVVLLCDFQYPQSANTPSQLRWHEVETLFHEMGHAIHSMIGRTEYHNVSGTRCATDFVELPSILMEHFVCSPQVIELVARHHRTGSPLPYELLDAHRAATRDLNSLDTHHQILLAALDQCYHSERVLMNGFDTTGELAVLCDKMGLVPFVEGSTWQGQFGHLFGYGASYYSYLLDRSIASRVWNEIFAEDPLSREAGERFKQEVLRFGGGKDPWHMLANLLNDPEIQAGDRHAMEVVGSWDTGDHA